MLARAGRNIAAAATSGSSALLLVLPGWFLRAFLAN
jgi:hypothetical protein